MTYDNSCGDGYLFEDEECDDGNNSDGDGCDCECYVEDHYTCTGSEGCTSTCTGICGDGYVSSDESCDDGGLGGCQSDCSGDACGWTCSTNCENFSECHPINCGDGTLDAGEECDDGNNSNEDGCSSICTVEAGWTCPASCF